MIKGVSMSAYSLNEKEKTVANSAIKHFMRDELITKNFNETVNALITIASIEMYGTDDSEKIQEIEGELAFKTVKNAINFENLNILGNAKNAEEQKKVIELEASRKTRDFIYFSKDIVGAVVASHADSTFNGLINDIKSRDTHNKIKPLSQYRS